MSCSFSVAGKQIDAAYGFHFRKEIGGGETTVSVLHDVQLLLNKQQQICGGVYIH